MKLRIAAFTLAVITLCGWTFDRNISGTYIATDRAGVAMLQLVESADGKLTGQFQAAALAPDGQLISRSLSVAGTANDGKMALTLSEPGGSANLFGIQKGDILELNGAAEFGTMDFSASEPAKYQQAFQALQTQSQSILAQNAQNAAREKAAENERQFIAQLTAFLPEIETFNANQEKRLRQISALEQSFAAIVTRMSEYLDRERNLAGIRQASVERGQISVQVGQGSVAYEQAHVAADWDAAELQNRIKVLSAKESEAENRCRSIAPATAQNIAVTGSSGDMQACEKLFEAGAIFRNNVSVISQALDKVDEAYRENLERQKAIVAEADRIE